MRKKTLFGFIIVIIGLNILFNAMRISTGSLVAPLIFFILGMFFYQRKHTFLSMFFFIVSASIFFDQLLGMNFVGLLIAGAALYYGVRLVRSSDKKKEKRTERRKQRKEKEAELGIDEKDMVYKQEQKETELKQQEQVDSPPQSIEIERKEKERFIPTIRRSWIGDIHYTGEAFELSDLTIWNGIGDVRLDLSKAIIPEGETVIIVQGIICEIDFYVPEDLAVAVQATSMVGGVSLFHEKHEGLNQQLSVATKGYKQAPRRVKLVLSTFVGEVKVRTV